MSLFNLIAHLSMLIAMWSSQLNILYLLASSFILCGRFVVSIHLHVKLLILLACALVCFKL